MCGFLLAYGPHISHEQFSAALGKMSYRGEIERSSSRQCGGWWMGHVQLPMQSESPHNPQPFARSDGRYSMFVGEFFPGPHMGDWAEWVGEAELLEYVLEDFRNRIYEVDGFWSMATVNPYNSDAYVMVDHIGNKPVYIWPDKHMACSEITPMFALSEPPPFDQVFLSNCMKFGYDYSGRTAWQGIYQVPPGTIYFFHPKEGSLFGDRPSGFAPYWDWGSEKLRSPLRLSELVNHALGNRVTKIIDKQRPMAMLFSGGLDSSILFYSLEKLASQAKARGEVYDFLRPTPLCLANGEDEKFVDPNQVWVLPQSDEVSLNWYYQAAVSRMEAPIDLGSVIPQIRASNALGFEGFRCVLTGDGADELFGGYRRSKDYDSQASDVFSELPYYHLPRLDRVFMRNTLEVRAPFLSPFVMKRALELPRHLRTDKAILKREFQDILPSAILQREKHPLKSKPSLNTTDHRNKLMEAFLNVFPNRTTSGS